MGCGVRSSQATKAAPSPVKAANPARIGLDDQPRDCASMIAQTSETSDAIDSAAPRVSTGGVLGSDDSGTRGLAASSATITIGTLTRNTEPHQK